jgi:hypothetical protein
VAGLPTVEVVAAEDYDREVNDLCDQVQMYEEKAERDWRDFGEMQDARIAADDRVAALDDLVQRAWSLIAGAMSGNPHKPTANSEWMDAAHAWEIDYCMGQGSSVPEYPTVSYRVRDRDSDYKAMCHEDRDHAELLLKAWLANGRDAVIERRHVFDGGWLPVGRPFFTGQQERMLDRCEAFDAANPDPETDT